jgi:DNA polymerase III sliding clamp (beta) subunit (PCNA family)
MKIPRYKIEEATCKESTRYGIEDVYFDAQKNILVATDGHQISVVPCESEPGDVSYDANHMYVCVNENGSATWKKLPYGTW